MSRPSDASYRVVQTACPLCSGRDWTKLVGGDDEDFDWVRCRCSLVFKTREPNAAASVRDAVGDAIPNDTHYEGAYFDRYARRPRRRRAKSRRQILDALEVAPPGELLDVGCSLGYALDAARSLGLAAHGVEVSEHALVECRRRGLEVTRGDLLSLPFEDGRFSVVLLKHVFEHTPEPRAALAELRRVLRPGGAAFFAVPNAEYRRGVPAGASSRFFRGEAGRAHYVYWSPDTLARMLANEGFAVASVHPRLLHRRAGAWCAILDAVSLPLRLPLRAAMQALALRKEFWLLAQKIGARH
jgi:SAM-dependent methyltransferase